MEERRAPAEINSTAFCPMAESARCGGLGGAVDQPERITRRTMASPPSLDLSDANERRPADRQSREAGQSQ